MAELTVVVPTYNGSEHLAATLDSLADQSAPVTVIVVDDGSTDASLSIATDHPGVHRVLAQRNRGVAAARNRGLAIAETEYVAFLDQDDLWHPSRTQCLLDLAKSTGAAAVGTTEQAFALSADRPALESMGDGRAAWPSTWIERGTEGALLASALLGTDRVEALSLTRLMRAPVTVTTALMYEREAAITAGGCATFVKAADDHVLNVNMARIFGPIQRIDIPSVFYRVHPASTTNISPMVTAFLTLHLALRHGRALPDEPVSSAYLDNLLWNVDGVTEMSRAEQMALITLSSLPGTRRRWVARWAKRVVKRRLGRSER